MLKFILVLLALTSIATADVKISQLPLGSAAATNINDSFPYVNFVAGSTQRLKLSDLINLPTLSAALASKQASGNYISGLTGDVSAAGPGNVVSIVNSVGSSSSANIHTGELLANGATALNTGGHIVLRDSTGRFIATEITSDLIGDVTGDLMGNADTSSAFATSPTTCGGSQFATGVNASGNAICGTPAGAGDVSSDTATSVDGEVVLFKGSTGKLVKRATASGVAHLSSGVLSGSNIVNADVDAAAAIAYSKLNLSGGIVNADVNASAAIVSSKISFTTPGVFIYGYTDGAGHTYNKTAGTTWIEVIAIGPGAGGGGGGAGAGTGSAGVAATTFNAGTALISAASGGAGGGAGANGGAGGVGTCGTGNGGGGGNVVPISEETGSTGGGGNSPSVGLGLDGGCGGASANGTGGSCAAVNGAVGTSAPVGSGGGGQGGSGTGAAITTGGGGGGGGLAICIIPAPNSAYTYVIPDGGALGAAGTSGTNGGKGGSGKLIVIEHSN